MFISDARFMGFAIVSQSKTMRVVQREGERFTYRVESSSHHGMAHVVTLTANNGLGACTCESYRFGAIKVQKKGVYIEWRPGRKGCSECRHIWGARRHFITKQLNPLLGAFDKGQPENVGDIVREFFAWKGL